MRIKTSEIELILEGLREEKINARTSYDFMGILLLEKEWEERWYVVSELEDNESILDWLG